MIFVIALSYFGSLVALPSHTIMRSAVLYLHHGGNTPLLRVCVVQALLRDRIFSHQHTSLAASGSAGSWLAGRHSDAVSLGGFLHCDFSLVDWFRVEFAKGRLSRWLLFVDLCWLFSSHLARWFGTYIWLACVGEGRVEYNLTAHISESGETSFRKADAPICVCGSLSYFRW